MNEEDELLQHKFFDKNIDKKMWILFYQIPIISQSSKKIGKAVRGYQRKWNNA